MAEQIAVAAAKKPAELLTGQAWQQIQYLFNYNSNITKLTEKVKSLEDKEGAIKLQVDAAERNAEIIGPDVLEWLKKVDNIKKEANEVLERTKNAEGELGCLFCECPKLYSRYNLSKQAFEKTSEISELQESTFETVGHPAPPGQMPFASPQEIDGFESRVRIVNDVMEALRNNSITMIGICGMAGVGKTTLVKQIADEVKAKNLFDEVAMAVVSNDVSFANIQDQLAENLGLTIEKKTNHPRAERLYTRLMNKGEKTLLILDDLWQELDLRNIGIPVAGEREGLKVLLTSRYKGVCNKMRARPIEVEVLSRKESWHLFKETADISDEANNIKLDIAKEVTKECGGLPLAIMIVAKALKNKEDYVWREALEELKEASVTTSIPDMHNLVNSRIMLSYKYLAGNTKLLLLLCSLFPEDYKIPLEDLVRYAKGLQLFKNVTVARARDKVYSITDELKSCYLLLAGNKGCVKLHDVVRDVCLSIVSSDEHMYMVRHAGLKEWPQEDCYTPYSAISLTFDEIDELPSGLECPKLQLLRLNFREVKLHISKDFFEGMNELKVLELNLNGELPSSLQSLVNLRTLCLYNCRLFGDISAIGSLKELEILSFCGSCVKHFPNEIVQLSNLKILDLTCKEGPAIPSGILVNLKKLEELYLDSCDLEYLVDSNKFFTGKSGAFINLEKLVIRNANNLAELCRGNLPPGSFARLREVRLFNLSALRHLWGAIQYPCLGNLRILDIDTCVLIRSLFLRSSLKCLRQLEEIIVLKCLMLETLVSNDEGDEKDTRDIEFPKLKILKLDGLKSFRSFSSESGHEILFRKVILPKKTLKINRVSGIRCIVDGQVPIGSLSNLEELCHENLPLGSFARLREVRLDTVLSLRHLGVAIQLPCLVNLSILDIRRCGSIRSLFLQSSLKCLRQLQRITIVQCQMLETVVSNDEEDEKDTGDVEFPKLSILELGTVESFKSFGPESGDRALFKKVMLPNLERLKISLLNGIRRIVDDQMPTGSLSKLRTLEVQACHEILHVAASGSIQLLQCLEQLRVHGAASLEVVFDFTDLLVEEADIESPLSWLESLSLEFLPNIKHIWRMLPKGIHAFKNLRSLSVAECKNLRFILSPSMAKILVSLETLKLGWCQKMEVIIGRDERLTSEIESDEDIVNNEYGVENTNKIEFPKLRCLDLKDLKSFSMFCSENIDLELPSLTELKIQHCPKMTKFCAGRLSAIRLNNVQVDLFGTIKVPLDEFSSWLKDCESRIRCLKCSLRKEERCDHLD